MVCEDTLRIKNMPKELTSSEKEDLLRHFGAVKVKTITSKSNQKSVVFAKFASKEMAKAVLLRLHQLTILNCRLCVEYAEVDISSAPTKANSLANTGTDGGDYFQQFLKRLNSWNIYSFQQPPPYHLKYSYPKANRATINNIAYALASVPKFYTQVLHLMNKMNLPPPFANNPDVDVAQSKPSITKTQTNSSDDESELESDEDDQNKQNYIIPAKRTLDQKKVVKRPKFLKPNPSVPINKETDAIDDVFERVDLQKQPKIQLKLNATLPEENNQTQNNNAGIDAAKIITTPFKMISAEELENGRMPKEKFELLPIFKDYKPGVPAEKLYIKNIAKAVDVNDLEYIYRKYHISTEGDKQDRFDIKLMKEGRMKGQAFVTFNSIESAQLALEETNAFVLKDKPLVVMFAKSATTTQKNS